jgi:hypothetical protein
MVREKTIVKIVVIHSANMVDIKQLAENAEAVHSANMVSEKYFVKIVGAVKHANMLMIKDIVKIVVVLEYVIMVSEKYIVKSAKVLDYANTVKIKHIVRIVLEVKSVFMQNKKHIVKSAEVLNYVNRHGVKRQEIKNTKATVCPASSTILKMLEKFLHEITRQKRSPQLIILEKYILILIGLPIKVFKMAVLVVVPTCYWIWDRILSSWK